MEGLEDERIHREPTEEKVKEDVVNYLRKVLMSIDIVIDNAPTLPSYSAEVLVEQIARKLVHAFSPAVLTLPLPDILANHPDSFSASKEDYDSDDDDEDNLIKDIPVPRKNRRVDYLRSILRGMAPISFDVAAYFQVTKDNFHALILLFGTWLPLAPHVTPLVSQLFVRSSENPFEFENDIQKWHQLEALHALCRHYAHRKDHATLKSFWSWAPLFLCLKNDAMEVDDWSAAPRWHAARAVGYLLNMSPGNMGTFLKQNSVHDDVVPWILHPWIIHEEEFHWEEQHKKGVVCLLHVGEEQVVLPTTSHVRQVLHLPSSLVHIGQGLVFHRNVSEEFQEDSGMIRTDQVERNLSLLATVLALEENPPILLCGPPGSGKSTLVRHLHKTIGVSLLELHVDDDTDSKTLIGSYTTTDIPGEFTWQPGALTRAVREGQWVLMEDLDTVPIEIQAALIPLIQDRQLPVGIGGAIEICHPNFRLFATLSTSSTSRRNNNHRILSDRLWRRVTVDPLPLEEWRDIGRRMYPAMPLAISDAALDVLRQALHIKTAGRPAAVRDFLKLLSRISNSVAFEDSQVSYATEAQRTFCLAETLDVFAAHNPDVNYARDFATRVAAPAWGLTGDIALHYLHARRPELIQSDLITQIGRATLEHKSPNDHIENVSTSSTFAPTNTALRLMESIAVCVRENEPLLLVGETGCGKTTVVQQLAQITDRTLVVQNLSLQTDSTDLLGGYRPLEISQIARTIYLDFVEIFVATFSRKQNADFLNFASSAFQKSQWQKLSQCFRRAAKLGLDKVQKIKGKTRAAKLERWKSFAEAGEIFERQRLACDTKLAFAFTEGALVSAIRTGKWVLLDEINLASSETLQRLCGLLDDSSGSVTLTERGDAIAIQRHPDFRLFAAMNPATDAGKKDLPVSIRSRFTEIYVDELSDPVELRTVAARYLSGVLSTERGPIEHSQTVVNVVETYLKSRELATKSLVDSGGQRPRYTLRTMCRGLTAARNLITHQRQSLKRGIIEGFELAFEGPLAEDSLQVLRALLQARLGQDISKDELNRPGRRPGGRGLEDEHVLIKPFWIERGPLDIQDWSEATSSGRARFILTKTMAINLRRISRAVAAGPWPVLLEGPTSAGKTTLVEYLAARCGHKVVRINNHEHTDVQEYTGSYGSDENGALRFRDGILVQALRKGHWVILDELNLAPSEVLEALNRLLDDNRELYLAEVNEIVKPHPNFRLFATQNPSGAYGGRKPLSRAFRNRFVEIHMGDIPADDMITILEKRSGCPSSHAKLLVKIMGSLRQRRSKNGVFLGKDGLITPRDLLRWAERNVSNKVELAEEGFMILGERLRSEGERQVVREEIEKHLNVAISPEELYYGKNSLARNVLAKATESKAFSLALDSVAPTRTILRLLSIVLRCVKQKEPVLLVGDTGCGKTTVVQLLSTILQRELKIINCHATTETSDLIGGLRPVRGRSNLLFEMFTIFRELERIVPDSEDLEEASPVSELLRALDKGVKCENDLSADLGSEIILATRALWKRHNESTCCAHLEEGKILKKMKVESGSAVSTEEMSCRIEGMVDQIEVLYRSYISLFEWVDGSLVQSMRKGDIFLMDEMSLAEDAVLERLNSVLEPSRTIVLAEKGDDGLGNDSHVVRAHNDFLVFATMNPGGDFGKRELSPALRSRFTEIWVPGTVDMEDIKMVLDSTFSSKALQSSGALVKTRILEYVQWFNTTVCGDPSSPCATLCLSLRDIISWAQFILEVSCGSRSMTVWEAFCHGASLMHLDGLGLGTGLSHEDAASTKRRSEKFLLNGIPEDHLLSCQASMQGEDLRPVSTIDRFGIHPFSIPYGPNVRPDQAFNFQAPTTGSNLLRVLRAMQLSKPVLLEGSPGVGKTSLISALAKASGYNLVRINLSEQTDIADLMGCDLPLPDGDNEAHGTAFKWCDGVLLEAIKRGDWVLLDELNLATQSVLEGLNSCLDHRASVFIPELGETFDCPSSFRVFAAQNPLGQGGGRKGLPKSFLNRFTKVYVEALKKEDLQMIVASSFPSIPEATRVAMVGFNDAVHTSVVTRHEYGDSGNPWEFNLRDVFRWCELSESCEPRDIESFGSCARDVYLQRFRISADRELLSKQYAGFFSCDSITTEPNECIVSAESMMIGFTSLDRQAFSHDASPVIEPDQAIMRSLFLPMEAVSRCIKMNWPCLLVGPAGTGKTSILRTLSTILNVKLVEVCLTPSTDVNELVGSFEQVDTLNNEKQLLSHLQASVRHVCTILEGCNGEADLVYQIYSKYEALSNAFVNRATVEEKRLIFDLSSDLLTLIIGSKVKNSKCVQQAGILLRRVSETQESGDRGGGCFRWADGVLVDAMTKGYWLHLENVNLCSASVLDRLNPVMEPGGELLLTETGTQDGGSTHRLIRPHRDFRLFLSMCPERGEVSRAMRNRCVEVSLLNTGDGRFFDKTGLLYSEKKTVDQLDALSRIGLRSMDTVAAILRVHQIAVDRGNEIGAHTPSIEIPGKVASGSCKLFARGVAFDSVLKSLFQLSYGTTGMGYQRTESNGQMATMLPMVPCTRESVSLNSERASSLFGMRLVQLQRRTLPAWLQRFNSRSSSSIQSSLNEVCPIVPNDPGELEILEMQSVVFYLLQALERGVILHRSAAFLDRVDNLKSRFLHFIAKKLLQFDSSDVRVMVDRLAFVALEKAARQRAEQIEKVQMDGNLHVYDVSFWLHVGKVERSTVSCPLTPAVFPLFQVIDEWAATIEHAVSLSDDSNRRLDALILLRDILRVRDHLWRFFRNAIYVLSDALSFLAFDETRFLVQWIWFKKGIASVDDYFANINVSSTAQRHNLDTVVANIDRILLDGDEVFDLKGDLLWKRGGHPAIPGLPHLWEAIQDIRQCCSELSVKKGGQFDSLSQLDADVMDLAELLKVQHPMLFLSTSHKQELLEALCMAHWSSTDESRGQAMTSEHNGGDYRIVCKRVEHAKAHFTVKWKATQVDTTIATVENLMDVDALEKLQIKLDHEQNEETIENLPLKLMSRFADLQIAPFVEFWLIHEEQRLLGLISCMITSDLGTRETRVAIATSAQRFVQVALSCAAWQVEDLRPFQTLIWAFKSWIPDKRLRSMLLSLLPTMLLNYSKHIWTNTFNNLGVVSTKLEFPNQWGASVGDGPRREVSSICGGSVGPTRLREHVRTDVILRLVGPEFSAAMFGPKKANFLTLENHDVREIQSRELLICMSTLGVDLRRPNFPMELCFLFSNVIESLEQFFSFEDYSRVQSILSMAERITDEDAASCLFLLNRCTHSRFKECLDNIVRPLVLSLSTNDVASVWLFVGLLRVHLLVPQSPLDPGKKPIAKVQEFDSRLSCLQSTIAAYRLDTGMRSGNFNPDDPTVQRWMTECKTIVRKKATQEKKMVKRDSTSPPFIDLFREVRRFWKAAAVPSVVGEIVRCLKSVPQVPHQLESALSRELNWQTTAASFCNRLICHFGAYEDVTTPLVVAIQCIQRGLRELRDCCAMSSSASSCVASDCVANLLRFPFSVNEMHFINHNTAMKEIVRPSFGDSRGAKKCSLALSLSTLSRYALQKHVFGYLTSRNKKECLALFDGIVKAWIKHVDGLTVQYSTDDEAQERMYREQFPDHNKEFANFIESQEEFSDDEVEEDLLIEETQEMNLTDDHISIMYNLYQELFSGDSKPDLVATRLRSFQISYGCAHLYRQLVASLPIGGNRSEDMSSHCLAISLSACGRTFIPSTIRSRQYSFHRDPNPTEVRKAAEPLRKLLLRTSQLLTAFPGHEVLIALGQVTEYVRKLELTSTSIGKAMTGLEVVLRKAQEWEQHASERVKLGHCLLEISQVVSTWRKLELSSWASLLSAREERCVKHARRHWMRLYCCFNGVLAESMALEEQPNAFVIRSVAPSWVWKSSGRGGVSPSYEMEINENHLDELTKLMDTFVLTSSVGEFQERMGLIKALTSQLSTKGDSSSIATFRLLASLHSYYFQFSPFISLRLTALRSPIESKLKDDVKLAKWDEQSYYRLVDSTERNHRKLMKHLREYDEVLDIPITTVLQQHYSNGIRASGSTEVEACHRVPGNGEMFPLVEHLMEDMPKKSWIDTLPILCKTTANWVDADIPCDAFVRRLGHYQQKMSDIVGREVTEFQSWAHNGACNSSDICSAIFNRIESVRKEKTTKPMKQRAVTDLFKELKRNGFKTTKWSVPSQMRQMMHVFQLPIPSTSSPGLPQKIRAHLDSGLLYCGKTMSELQRLRSEVALLGSRHMSMREMELMTNMSNHGLLLIFQQRSLLAEALIDIEELKAAVCTLSSISTELPIGQTHLLQLVIRFDFAIAASREFICQLRLLIASILPMVRIGDVGHVLRDVMSLFDECIVAVKQYRPPQNRQLVTLNELEDIRLAVCTMETVRDRVMSAKVLCCQNHACLPVDAFDSCLLSIKKVVEYGTTCATNYKQAGDLENESLVAAFTTSASSTIEAGLLAVQKVHKMRDECVSKMDKETDDDDGLPLWESHKRALIEWDNLNIRGLTTEMKGLTNALVSVHDIVVPPEGHRKWFVSIATETASLINQVLNLSISRVEDSILFFKGTAKLQYVIARVFRTLVSKGYCADSKSEDDNEGEGGGDASGMKFEDDVEGTGMGEGDGKEDVTDQLESEEQLLGLQDENQNEHADNKKDPKELNEEEAKKGMEMEADFEGDMFDVPEDNKEDEQKDNQDDEEELDREMGEGSDEKEDVVDEKMWGDSDDEDDINQEEEKFEKDSKTKGESIEDQMRTKEEGEDESKPEGEGGEGEQKPQGVDEKPTPNDDCAEPEINDDLEEKYEDKQGVEVRNEEQERDDNEDEDNGMELDDDLNLNDDNLDNVEEADDKNDEENDLHEEDGPTAASSPVEAEENVDENEDEDEVMETNAVHDGASGEQNEENDEDDQQDELDGPRVNQSTAENSQQEAYGVKSKDGVDNIKEFVNEDEDKELYEEGGQGEDEDTGAGNDDEIPDEPSTGTGGNQGSGGQREEGQGTDAEASASQSEAPNPFNNPGDATMYWHKKLKMVERGELEPQNDEETAPTEEESKNDDGKQQGEFEYAPENEANTTQVLAETTDDVTTKFDGSEQEEADSQEEKNAMEETEPSTSDDTQTTEQKSSRKASKPTPFTKTIQDEPNDVDCAEQEDEHKNLESDTEEETADECMGKKDDDLADGGNQVVSDLAQIKIGDEDNEVMELDGGIVEDEQTTGISSEEAAASRRRWNMVASETHNLSRRLCEKLRLVMEPLLATKLKGDYRTGKRINMKKVIGYIASGYRKDKIWLRRTKPAKRNYRVLLAVDNSESMDKSGAGDMALAAMATLATGMSQLEIGELGIASFGDEMRLLHPFHLPFTSESGANIVHSFPFDEKRTRTSLCVESALKAMDMPGDCASLQLIFMISDGRIERDSRAVLRRLMREMVERNILLVMIVVEGYRDGSKRKKDSIVHMKEVTFENGKPKVKQFIEDYPFPYYIILDDMQSLPEVLGDSLRQWFEMIAQLQQNGR